MKAIIGVLRLIAIIIATIYSVTAGLVVLLLTFNTDKCVQTAVPLFSKSLFFICNVKHTSYGHEHVSKEPSKIYVSNHSSHFDPPALALSSQVPLYFIAKKELARVPFLGWYIYLSGMIFVDRKNKAKAQESIRKAGEKVKNGKNIISFAEGTRSKTGELMLFKKGAFRMAQAHQIDIVPVGIYGARDVLPSGEWLIKSGHISVKYGEVMKYEDYKNHSLEEFAAECKKQVAELIEELKDLRSE